MTSDKVVIDGNKVLAEMSGVSETQIGNIMKEVKANIALLDTCARHDFGPRIPLQRKYACSNCGGTVDTAARYWYGKGLEHAGHKSEA